MYKIEQTKKWMLKAGAVLFALLMMIQMGAYPVQASEYWPEGTEIVSPNAIVMELSTGTILYEKESLEQHDNTGRTGKFRSGRDRYLFG